MNRETSSDIRLHERLKPKQALFEFYTPRFWFWEVLETVHRLLLTGVLVVIAQGTGAQIIVGVTLALFFLKLIDYYRPYTDPSVQHIRVMCQWQLYLVFFLALVLKADFASVNRTALDALLILIIIANVVMDVVRVVRWGVCSLLSPELAGKEFISNPLSLETEEVSVENGTPGLHSKDVELSEFGQ